MLRVVLVIDDYNELIYLETVLKKLGFVVEGLQNPRKYFDVSLGFNPHIAIVSARGKKVDGLQLAQGIPRRRGLPKIIAMAPSDQRLSQDEIDAAEIDHIIETPVNPKKLVLAISSVGDLDEQALWDKYQRIKGGLPTEMSHAPVLYDDNGQPATSIRQIQTELEMLMPAVSPTEHEQAEELVDSREPSSKPSSDQAQNQSTALSTESSSAQTPLQTANRQKRNQEWLEKNAIKVTGEHFQRDRILDFNRKIRAAEADEEIAEVEDERRRYVKALFEAYKK